eukprot:scaffold770_cov255-Pinguiococcus_pyrenoidosus.AAC.73
MLQAALDTCKPQGSIILINRDILPFSGQSQQRLRALDEVSKNICSFDASIAAKASFRHGRHLRCGFEVEKRHRETMGRNMPAWPTCGRGRRESPRPLACARRLKNLSKTPPYVTRRDAVLHSGLPGPGSGPGPPGVSDHDKLLRAHDRPRNVHEWGRHVHEHQLPAFDGVLLVHPRQPRDTQG